MRIGSIPKTARPQTPGRRGHESVLDLLIAALWGEEDTQREKLAALSDRDLGRLSNVLHMTGQMAADEERRRRRG